MSLPGQGKLQYGTLDLSGPMVKTTGVRATPVLDSAQRTRLYNVYTVSLKLRLAGGTTDPAMKAARSQLLTPGLPFAYQDKGFSDIVIGGGAQDVLWGPIPKELGFKPLGGGNACEVDWEVQVAVAECAGAELRAGGAGFDGMELNWSASYAVDASGFTTRTLNVLVKIAGYRAGRDGRRLTDTADTYRELVSPPLVPGFRRTYGPWTINEAKTELRGSIVDAEMGPNYPPEWVIDIKASHDVSSSSTGLATWGGTIAAEYEVARNVPPGWSPVQHFLGVLVRDRIAATAASIQKSNSIIPISFSMTDPEIYGKNYRASYRLSYQFTQPLSEILGATGQWRPVPGSNWQLWAASMETGPANPRGFSQMVMSPGDDSIVDACGGRVPPVFSSAPKVPTPPTGPAVVGLPSSPSSWPGDTSVSSGGAFDPGTMPGTNPASGASWVHYECWLWVESDSGTIPVRPLPAKALDPIQDFPNEGPNEVFNVLTNGLLPAIAPPVFQGAPVGRLAPDAQQRVKPLVFVYLRGRALRHGFPVPIPTLKNVGGVVPVLACRLDRGEGFGQGQVFTAANQVLYGAQWNIRYQLADLPPGWFPPIPPNPLLAAKIAGGR